MKTERPILFNSEMVRAIFEGRKTQTRRPFKAKNGGVWPNPNDRPGMKQVLRNCPYGQPGYRLWVRETWAPVPMVSVENHIEVHHPYAYRADGDNIGCHNWRPSIHMPRKASRVLLEIVSVRVARLNDISESDARAEGVILHDGRGWYDKDPADGGRWHVSAREAFKTLWIAINGDDSWASNPWVWVVEFKRVDAGCC